MFIRFSDVRDLIGAFGHAGCHASRNIAVT